MQHHETPATVTATTGDPRVPDRPLHDGGRPGDSVGLSENVEKDRLIQDQREAHEAHCLEQQAKQEAKLAAGADKVEKVVADGKPATKYTTRYVFGKDGGAGKRAKDVGLGSFELAHAGGPHALESAYSPLFDDWYLYFADMSILHWASDPCGGWDDYAFAATVGCAEDTPTFSTSPCLYDAWIALQRSADGSTWTSPWGYSHRKNASPRASCHAQGWQARHPRLLLLGPHLALPGRQLYRAVPGPPVQRSQVHEHGDVVGASAHHHPARTVLSRLVRRDDSTDQRPAPRIQQLQHRMRR